MRTCALVNEIRVPCQPVTDACTKLSDAKIPPCD